RHHLHRSPPGTGAGDADSERGGGWDRSTRSHQRSPGGSTLVTTGKPTSTSEKPRIDSKILIVSFNVLGISALQAARAAGFLNVTVWERERPALECRSVVRTIERLHATLVVGCRQKSFEHRQVVGEGWLN